MRGRAEEAALSLSSPSSRGESDRLMEPSGAGHVFRGRTITTLDVDLRISSAGYDITPLTLSSVHKWHARDSLHTTLALWHNAPLRLHLSSASSAKTAPHPSSSHLTPPCILIPRRSRSTQTRSRVEHIPKQRERGSERNFPLVSSLAGLWPPSRPQGPLWSAWLGGWHLS